MRKLYAAMLIAMMALVSYGSHAAAQQSYVTQFTTLLDIPPAIPLINPPPPPLGTVSVLSDPLGTDSLQLFAGLGRSNANTEFTVFLANSRNTGAIPTQFLGNFVTDGNGRGGFAVTGLEVCNAHISANQSRENDLGVADNPPVFPNPPLPPGAIDSNANSNGLPFIRIYRAIGTLSVFGLGPVPPDGNSGGGHMASSVADICGPQQQVTF